MKDGNRDEPRDFCSDHVSTLNLSIINCSFLNEISYTRISWFSSYRRNHLKMKFSTHINGWRSSMPRRHHQTSQPQLPSESTLECLLVLFRLHWHFLKAKILVVAHEMQHHELGIVVESIHCAPFGRHPVEDGAGHVSYARASGKPNGG
jgi:hypothetical protein